MKLTLLSFLIVIILFVPVLTFAQIVPECPKEAKGEPGEPGYVPVGCGWLELVELAQNLINFLIIIALPLAGIAFVYAGFLYLTSAGSEERIKKAHGIFWKVGLGIVLVLGAWLIVWLIMNTLLPNKDFILLLE